MLLMVPVTITVLGCINLVQNDYYNSKRGHNIKLIAYSTVFYINIIKWDTVLFFTAFSHSTLAVSIPEAIILLQRLRRFLLEMSKLKI